MSHGIEGEVISKLEGEDERRGEKFRKITRKRHLIVTYS